MIHRQSRITVSIYAKNLSFLKAEKRLLWVSSPLTILYGQDKEENPNFDVKYPQVYNVALNMGGGGVTNKKFGIGGHLPPTPLLHRFRVPTLTNVS